MTEIVKTVPTGKVEIPWSDEWMVFECDKCGVPIVIGSYGDPRNYLYPIPDIFGDTVPEMDILCHDCFAVALAEDRAAKYGCSKCGEPVQEAKFYGESGVLCDECFNKCFQAGDESIFASDILLPDGFKCDICGVSIDSPDGICEACIKKIHAEGPCESCEHLKDDSCSRWETCAYCGNGFCYCDRMIDTEEGPMHADCAKKCYGEVV